jgi:hypothetical protein
LFKDPSVPTLIILSCNRCLHRTCSPPGTN